MANSELKSKVLSLLSEYRITRSIAVRNKIALMNMGLVRQVSHQMSNICSHSYEDLEQIAFIGLINAIERFDPEMNYAFSSFAVPSMKYEILHFLRDNGGSIVKVPRKMQELHQKAQKIIRQLSVSSGKAPNDTEISQALNIPIEDWRDCQTAVEHTKCLSIDVVIKPGLENPIMFVDCLPDYLNIEKAAFTIDRDELESNISTLPVKTKLAIKFVFFKGIPRKEAAKIMGVSPMTVTRHVNLGVQKLSSLLCG